MIPGCRIAVYSQDSLGLGHLRRNILIGEQMLEAMKRASVLLIADSPVAPFFRLPAGMDHIKLPSIRKVRTGHWEPTSLRIDEPHLRRLRADILRDAIVSFHPDLLLVDHMPGGAKGELIPALSALKQIHKECSVILGLRDILDAEEVIKRLWETEEVYGLIRRYYDRILIYGSNEIFDTGRRYRLPMLAHGIHYCGYVVNQRPQPTSETHHTFPVPAKPLVFVSAGGGGDSSLLMRTYVEAIRLLGGRADFNTIMAVGVNAAPELRNEVETKARGLPIQVSAYVDDGMTHAAAADLVVCMAGYNTMCEVLYLRKKALVIPRSGPSAEQRMRASLFAKMGLVDMLDPQQLTPEILAGRLLADLRRQDYPAHQQALDMSGARRAAARALELANKGAYAAFA